MSKGRMAAVAAIFSVYMSAAMMYKVLMPPDTRVIRSTMMQATQPPSTMKPVTEQPLPKYCNYYKMQEISLNESALSACSMDDKPLINSKAQPSAGCRKPKQPKGIRLKCETPVEVTCDIPRSKARQLFFKYLNRKTASCQGVKDVGDAKQDGVWKICMSGPFALRNNSCLVYSIGINFEWSFDDTISKTYGCEVHAFDPSMNTSDHKRDARISFHEMGIAGHGERFKEAEQKGWKMMTINDIIKSLGHQNRVIDILKADIEFAEWDAFQHALQSGVLKNVKQIATEFHVWSDHTPAYVRFYRLLAALENAGFEKWHTSDKSMFYRVNNTETGEMEKVFFQQDTGYINTRFL